MISFKDLMSLKLGEVFYERSAMFTVGSDVVIDGVEGRRTVEFVAFYEGLDTQPVSYFIREDFMQYAPDLYFNQMYSKDTFISNQDTDNEKYNW